MGGGKGFVGGGFGEPGVEVGRDELAQDAICILRSGIHGCLQRSTNVSCRPRRELQ